MRRLETDKDTICALATAHGIGAISVIRVSGSQAVEVVRKLASFLPEHLESHKIYYGILKSADRARSLDEVLVSYFQAGRSFTGETSFEISCHGSEAVVNEILSELIAAGARSARRGEFTYRAFMNGRLDLVQAESVLALIESRTTRASHLALRQLQGDFSKRLKSILDQVTWVLAQLEANIDFAAEDIEIAGAELLAEKLKNVTEETKVLLSSYRQGRIVSEGFHVLLVGRPNAGKSSLLNALAGEERAIVTEIAGTTRDFVEAAMVLDGYRVLFVDTAGLRHTEDPVEKIGVQRTLEKLNSADLIFYVLDGSQGVMDDERDFLPKIPWNKALALANKADLGVHPSLKDFSLAPLHPVSAVDGRGLEDLRRELRARMGGEVSEDSTLVSNARHFEGLQLLRKSLENSLPLVLDKESPDLIALELQTGLLALYEILGLTYDDQVMDRVFSEFCLGK